MTTQILDGPGRTLECIHPKFMVDLVLGADATRQPPVVPQQQQFRERLTQEIVTQTKLRPWAMAGMFSENAALRLGLAEKLAGMFDPGHLALTRMTDKLTSLRQQANPRGQHSPGLMQQYDDLASHFSKRAAYKEKALSQRGLMVQAGEHSEQIFTRWRAGHYDGWSLAGRCCIALEELRWGAFGDACRLANRDVSAMLKDNLRSMAANYLAQGIHASPTTRHFYHQWLTTPVTPGLMNHKDMLGWLGDWCHAERHPVCWSVTQSWQPVALGMPRLCSAKRLADAMVNEMFGE
ncbi:diguanylate cyclase regulator RdcB family protein [Huaxiibacter chinensis]|uniref:diguanylate cyclase regulator RdcB family protein n=1 Tax=Huaxiibacter chinensis TaxID=2899785 RepID=UPI003F999E7F